MHTSVFKCMCLNTCFYFAEFRSNFEHISDFQEYGGEMGSAKAKATTRTMRAFATTQLVILLEIVSQIFRSRCKRHQMSHKKDGNREQIVYLF